MSDDSVVKKKQEVAQEEEEVNKERKYTLDAKSSQSVEMSLNGKRKTPK